LTLTSRDSKISANLVLSLFKVFKPYCIFMRKLNFDKLHPANKGRMRDINEVIVLNLIRDRQPISRVQITRKTGLQISTVTVITKRLIEKGLIYEQGVAPSNGGRKPRLLGVRPEKVCVFGVDIGVSKTTLALANFNGEIFHKETFPTEPKALPFLNLIIDRIRHLMESYRYEVEYEGIGISATGIIDSSGGKIVFSPNLGWKDIDVRAIFEESLSLPVHVENDARASALAEAWHGYGKDSGSMNLVFVTINEGVGAGIILNGQLYRGASDGAGEFGHLSIDHNGPLCNCGNRGCWELYASDRAMINRFLKLNDAAASPRDPVSVRDVVRLAREGNEQALSSLKATATYIGLGTANIINTLNPETIVIGGDLTFAWDIIEPVICEAVEPKVFGRSFSTARIVSSSFLGEASLFGAIIQALSTKLSVARVA
jgi:glucokinase-like ROK family protein